MLTDQTTDKQTELKYAAIDVKRFNVYSFFSLFSFFYRSWRAAL